MLGLRSTHGRARTNVPCVSQDRFRAAVFSMAFVGASPLFCILLFSLRHSLDVHFKVGLHAYFIPFERCLFSSKACECIVPHVIAYLVLTSDETVALWSYASLCLVWEEHDQSVSLSLHKLVMHLTQPSPRI